MLTYKGVSRGNFDGIFEADLNLWRETLDILSLMYLFEKIKKSVWQKQILNDGQHNEYNVLNKIYVMCALNCV